VVPLEPYQKVWINVDSLFSEIEPVHAAIGCVTCHGGSEPVVSASDDRDDLWLAMAEAHGFEPVYDGASLVREKPEHQTIQRDPSARAEFNCNGAGCHASIVEHNASSMHTQLWGEKHKVALRSGYDRWEDCPAILTDGYNGECTNCHTTCGQCHVSRPTSVKGGFLDSHRFQRRPDVENNCTACHGSRVANDYNGSHAGNQPDIHNEAGFDCFFCHTEDLHGDGRTDYTSRYEVEGIPRCETCHAISADENLYHQWHWPDADAVAARGVAGLACQVCHSQPYTNCLNCHSGGVYKSANPEGYAEYADFKIGRNSGNWSTHPPEAEKYVVVRHVPVIKDGFREWGWLGVDNWAAFETWEMATPHNIRRVTPQTMAALTEPDLSTTNCWSTTRCRPTGCARTEPNHGAGPPPVRGPGGPGAAATRRTTRPHELLGRTQMKKLEKALALSVALTLTVFTGCSDDDDGGTTPTVNEFQTLVDHTDNSLADWTGAWIQSATHVHDNLANLYVIDLRSAETFDAGHIPGAHNVPALTGLLAEAANAGSLPIALVCYSGQTASFATMALRMMGYDDAFAMKWGMAGWNDNFAATWDGKIGSDYVASFSHDAAPALPEYGMPSLETGESTADGILAARVAEVLATGLTGKNAADVMPATDDYNILNYGWSDADYTGIGHIPGAYLVAANSLTSDADLTAVDPDGPNVVYCWTGQTSALMTCFLNVLGYETYSLRYGANSMVYSEIGSHQWPDGGAGLDYEFVSETDEFGTLVEYTDTMLSTWTTGWIKDATFVHDNLANLYVIDLRSATTFADQGHIAGAHNVPDLTGLLDEAANAGSLQIALVCYSGQTASFATMALRMAGYDDAFAMKWGMAGWNSVFAGTWDDKIGSDYVADFDHGDPPALPTFGEPNLTTGETTAENILAERIVATLAGGLTGKNAADVVPAYEDYNVINYAWTETDYINIGHIPGASLVASNAFTSDADLTAVDGGGPNVVYCWTGQTSALMTCFLNVLGYETYSLRYGANSMVWSEIGSHQWPDGGPGLDYDIVTGTGSVDVDFRDVVVR